MQKIILIARMRVISASLSVCRQGLIKVSSASGAGSWSGPDTFVGEGFCGFGFGSLGSLDTQSRRERELTRKIRKNNPPPAAPRDRGLPGFDG